MPVTVLNSGKVSRRKLSVRIIGSVRLVCRITSMCRTQRNDGSDNSWDCLSMKTRLRTW